MAEFGETLMLDPEYRAGFKLGIQQLDSPDTAIAEAYQCHYVDLCDLRLVGRFDYFQVPPSQRLWIWEDDLEQARMTSTSQRNRRTITRADHRCGGQHHPWHATLTRVKLDSLRTPNFAPDGPTRAGKTLVRTAVSDSLLARRKPGVQIPSPPPTLMTSGNAGHRHV
jgi:hypothetical protein